jgi:hypothetical protein
MEPLAGAGFTADFRPRRVAVLHGSHVAKPALGRSIQEPQDLSYEQEEGQVAPGARRYFCSVILAAFPRNTPGLEGWFPFVSSRLLTITRCSGLESYTRLW